MRNNMIVAMVVFFSSVANAGDVSFIHKDSLYYKYQLRDYDFSSVTTQLQNESAGNAVDGNGTDTRHGGQKQSMAAKLINASSLIKKAQPQSESPVRATSKPEIGL